MADRPEKQQRAVALKYDARGGNAPSIVAKGRGGLAEKILEVAKENNIPIHEDPDLVEVLSQLDTGKEISPELYQAVAEVLIFIYKMNQKKMERFHRDNQAAEAKRAQSLRRG